MKEELGWEKAFVFQNFVHLIQPFFVSPQVQKKNLIENIIPVIISLKTVLEKNKIPALRDLMHYLRVKMASHIVVGVLGWHLTKEKTNWPQVPWKLVLPFWGSGVCVLADS